MLIGNMDYDGPEDIPAIVPLFPLPAALLLPRGQMPLNIFEARYLDMIDNALSGGRVVGMVQPRFDMGKIDLEGNPALCSVGCVGRVTAFQESGDGRYLVTLTGVTRFRILDEVTSENSFRLARVTSNEFIADFQTDAGVEKVDRQGLLHVLKEYLDANSLEADWDSISSATTEALVNALSMMSPYGAAEKQALLEAVTLEDRANTLIAITEMELARGGTDGGNTLQ
ncbi:MAG: LON peptidase substrate-binding domain-containing protein [Stappiaceae bacterium]